MIPHDRELEWLHPMHVYLMNSWWHQYGVEEAITKKIAHMVLDNIVVDITGINDNAIDIAVIILGETNHLIELHHIPFTTLDDFFSNTFISMWETSNEVKINKE